MKIILLLIFLLPGTIGHGQETAETAQAFLEAESSATETDEIETEDAERKHAWYIQHKVNINKATADFLVREFQIAPLAAEQLIIYRRLAGPLIHIAELQAVPGWDPESVRSVMPFITIQDPPEVLHLIKDRIKHGRQLLQIRVGLTGEKSAGYIKKEPGGTMYAGSRVKTLIRYNFRAGSLLQWGLTVEKDAGERLLKGNKTGFDFSTFYFQVGSIGKLKSLIIGDFNVNMGQGLIHWQSSALRKNAETILTLRQGSELRVHSGTNEQQFHRGIAATFQQKQLQISFFAAYDAWDANAEGSADSSGRNYFTSIQVSGMHRTSSEIENKNALKVLNLGTTMLYRFKDGEIGLNAVGYRFSGIIKKDPVPENLYALNGNRWSNYSASYKYSLRNLYFFGEIATDKNFSAAGLNGVIATIHPMLDLTAVYRYISPAYRALQANTFTEQSEPNNESGLYIGFRFNPGRKIQVSGYADVFRFPWLKSTISSPSRGATEFLQLSWKPDKKNEVLIRWQAEVKQLNEPAAVRVAKENHSLSRRMLRIHQKWLAGRQWEFNLRFDFLWVQPESQLPEQGFLFYTDGLFKPLKSPFSVAVRVARFSTQGYESRVYSMERDVRNYHTINMLYGDGWRAYLLLNYKYLKYIVFSAKAMISNYTDKQTVGSGYDEINRPYRSDYRLQILVFF